MPPKLELVHQWLKRAHSDLTLAQDALAVARQVCQFVLDRLPAETHPDT